eukprot:ANDGO_03232.mRNA.1 hypothetical protein
MALVLGMGAGVFSILLLFLLSILAWYLASYTSKSVLYHVIIIVVMFLLVMFFIFAPKGEDLDQYGNVKEQDEQFWSRFALGFTLFFIGVPVAALFAWGEWAVVPIRNSKPHDSFSRVDRVQ